MPPHKQKDAQTPEMINGVILEYNISPRGTIEGVLVQHEGQVVQVNFPHEALTVALAAVGQVVNLAVEADPKLHKHPEGEHPVFQAACPEDSDPKHGEQIQLEGVVKRLNFARHGEPNGVVLENGDFLHLKPDGMHRAGLAVGQTVKATGKARPMPLGKRVIEADNVNGIDLRHKK